MFKREETLKIKVGNIFIGGSDNVIVQSMCNTKTYDYKSTIKQILELENAGCELIRVSVPDERSAYAIEKIKNKIHIPLIADIHFDYKLALMAIDRGIDKIRINPGNIGDIDKIKIVADKCRKKKIPIRIGVNSGSLSKKILAKYDGKVTARGLYESAKENIELLSRFDFNDIIVSIKSSDVKMCIEAYSLFAKKYKYPLHLGVTEAGTLLSGTIKSCVGLTTLLNLGIGDTMRVSLTSNPINEVIVANKILRSLDIKKYGIDVVSCPTCARTNIGIEKIANEVENLIIKNKLEEVAIKKKMNYKIAVMGCVVNGPGEAKEANIGIAGGEHSAIFFRGAEVLKKVDEDKIIPTLLKYIKQDLK